MPELPICVIIFKDLCEYCGNPFTGGIHCAGCGAAFFTLVQISSVDRGEFFSAFAAESFTIEAVQRRFPKAHITIQPMHEPIPELFSDDRPQSIGTKE